MAVFCSGVGVFERRLYFGKELILRGGWWVLVQADKKLLLMFPHCPEAGCLILTASGIIADNKLWVDLYLIQMQVIFSFTILSFYQSSPRRACVVLWVTIFIWLSLYLSNLSMPNKNIWRVVYIRRKYELLNTTMFLKNICIALFNRIAKNICFFIMYNQEGGELI